jgi:hypothetical protein
MAARRFAMTRDSTTEDYELLAQYAAVAWAPAPSPAARASSAAPGWRREQKWSAA